MKQVEERLSTSDFVSVGEQENREAKPAAASARQADNRQAGERQPDTDAAGPFFTADIVQDLRNRWRGVQAGFVDEPRTAVQQADELVAAAMKRLAEGFAEQRSALEHQWDRGDDVSTEDLRLALRKYRTFFERLLAIQSPVAAP
jgi:hypothetical protein